MNIKENINKPEELERYYRTDKKGFEKAFFDVYKDISNYKIAGFWKTRLEFKDFSDSKIKCRKADLVFLIIVCLSTWFLSVMPLLFNINTTDHLYYEKNAGLIVMIGLSLYMLISKRSLTRRHWAISLVVFIISAIYVNLLPLHRNSQSVNLAYIHLPLFLWCFYGMIFADFKVKNKVKRIEYIKYNGDMAVFTSLIFVAGGVLTVVTLVLFSAIGLNIGKFYFNYFVIPGMIFAPVVATYIVRNFSYITDKIAPVLAWIFSPLVLITLGIYLISIVVTGKDPYNNRDFLLVFNMMLLGVTAIIVFSASEISANKRRKCSELILFILSVVTLIVGFVALSAILYRLIGFGFTPNRAAVLGSNLLILGNIVLLMVDLYKSVFKGKDIKSVELTIAKYLPVYAVWTFFVTFGFPFIFGLK